MTEGPCAGQFGLHVPDPDGPGMPVLELSPWVSVPRFGLLFAGWPSFFPSRGRFISVVSQGVPPADCGLKGLGRVIGLAAAECGLDGRGGVLPLGGVPRPLVRTRIPSVVRIIR